MLAAQHRRAEKEGRGGRELDIWNDERAGKRSSFQP